MSLYDAIFSRTSCRKFRQEPVSEDRLVHLEKYVTLIRALDPKIRTRFLLVRAEDGQIPGGRFVVKAPYYLVLYSEEAPGYLANAGYLMEQAVLYLTVYGVGTCYQGSADASVFGDAPGGMRPVITVAFGLPARENARSRTRRKKLSEICTFREDPGAEVRKILEAGRAAPSALNRQPWHFAAGNGRIHVFLRPTPFMKGQELDTGIALLHLMLAAEEAWYTPKFVRIRRVPENVPGKMTYIGTVLLEYID